MAFTTVQVILIALLVCVGAVLGYLSNFWLAARREVRHLREHEEAKAEMSARSWRLDELHLIRDSRGYQVATGVLDGQVVSGWSAPLREMAETLLTFVKVHKLDRRQPVVGLEQEHAWLVSKGGAVNGDDLQRAKWIASILLAVYKTAEEILLTEYGSDCIWTPVRSNARAQL